MDGKGTERQLGKMSHLLSPLTLVVVALSVLVAECSEYQSDGRVCYYGQERDSENGKLRWIMPSEDHKNRCFCTRIKVGGVNPTFVEGRIDGANFTDKPLFTGDAWEIRDHFQCEGTSTNQPSITTNDPPTTTTDPPTTNTDPPTTTKDPPTTPTKPTDPPTTTTKPGHADCQSLLDAGHTGSGVYNITPAQYRDGLDVYCDMTTDDSKGWILFQRRVDGTVNFTRSWAEYRDGFGDKEGEFWLGNGILRRLTERVDGEQGWQLRVDLIQDAITTRSGVYDDFHVDGENYTLHVGAYRSLIQGRHLGDALSSTLAPPSNGQPFSTYDRDNDAEPSPNCADEFKGGWWFNQCTLDDDGDTRLYSNLNGEYSQRYPSGIVWKFVTYSSKITRSEMKMRRVP